MCICFLVHPNIVTLAMIEDSLNSLYGDIGRSSRALRCARSRTRMCWCAERPAPRSARASGASARRQEARVHVMNDHEARVPAVQLAALVQYAHVLEPLVRHLQPREQHLRSVRLESDHWVHIYCTRTHTRTVNSNYQHSFSAKYWRIFAGAN